jgi:hypothetical protein
MAVKFEGLADVAHSNKRENALLREKCEKNQDVISALSTKLYTVYVGGGFTLSAGAWYISTIG